jgi:hypothetical protein
MMASFINLNKVIMTCSQMENEKKTDLFWRFITIRQRNILREYAGVHSASTIDCVKYLREKFCGQRMVFIGDGVAYHKAREVKEYLA